MHPGVADVAEREQVGRVVVRGIAVDMVDVKIPLSAADGAPLPVALQDLVPDRLPSRQGVLLPHPDGGREPFAVDGTRGPRGKRTLAAEPTEAVPVGMVAAEGALRTVERVQVQLKVGAHDQKRVGCKTG